jgi:phosphate:Na+ symporter
MNTENTLQLLAGIALFVFAMTQLEEALKHLAGRSFKVYLQKRTNHPLRAILSGTLVTAILQSSSVVLLMTLSFVGAGVMNMRNALAVTYGANLGTTASSWIVATLGFRLELEAISYPLLALALLVRTLFSSNNQMRHLAGFLTGFALLFLGLEWMKDSVQGLLEHVDLSHYAHFSPYWYVPLGLVITAVVQSSSATMAMALAALHGGMLPYESAVGVVIGSEIGTSLKILLGAWGGTADKKRVAFGNLLFNVAATGLAMLLLYPLIDFLREGLQIRDPLIALVAFQSATNFIAIVAVYPWIGAFARFLQRRFVADEGNQLAKFLHRIPKTSPGVSLQNARQETYRLLRKAVQYTERVFGIESREKRSRWEAIKEFAFVDESTADRYSRLKRLHGEILEYIVEIQKEELSPQEIDQTGKLITISRYSIHAAKNAKDIQHNLGELSSSANDVLDIIYRSIVEGQRNFTEKFVTLLDRSGHGEAEQELSMLMDQCNERHTKDVHLVLEQLQENSIDELGASTLLNVFREIHSAQTLLLTAMRELNHLGVQAP